MLLGCFPAIPQLQLVAAWCVYTEMGMGLPPQLAWTQLLREQKEIRLIGAIPNLKPLSTRQISAFHVQTFARIRPQADTCRLQRASDHVAPWLGRCQHFLSMEFAGIHLWPTWGVPCFRLTNVLRIRSSERDRSGCADHGEQTHTTHRYGPAAPRSTSLGIDWSRGWLLDAVFRPLIYGNNRQGPW
jgi:hypothetical protein